MPIRSRLLKQQLASAKYQLISKDGGTGSDSDNIDRHFQLEKTSATATKHLSPKGQMALAIRRNVSNIAAKAVSGLWG